MEYVPGIKINRIQALDQLGVDRKRYQPKFTNTITNCRLNLHTCEHLLLMVFVNSH